MNNMLFAEVILIVNQQWRLLEDVMLFVIKGFFAFEDNLECIWLQRLTISLCLKVSFPLKKVFIDEVLLALVNTTMMEYV
jgi:hypothetical protein